ncbi:MAG: CPBP family intramembrane metalloprotease [Chloroflexi bacterium]|nr:CPBP family intramembrane metalloprotease [Chloroflexota bacterium]
MVNPLWNPEERRVRSFWRIVAHFLLFLILTSLLQGLVYGAASIAYMATGASLDQAQLLNAVMSDPLVDVFSRAAYLTSMLLAIWLAARFLDRRRISAFGLQFNAAWWADFAFGLGLGAVLMLLIFLFELAMGWVTVSGSFLSSSGPFGLRIIAALFTFIVVGIVEELLSRGYQLHNLAEGLNFRFLNPRAALLLAYLITSSIFGFLHFFNPNASWTSTVNLILAGLFLGLGYVLTGQLAIPIGLHISWNFFQGNVFGFPVSGTTSGVTLIGIEQGGPELWTGGAFGPETGRTGLLAMALGSLLTFLWVRSRYRRVELKDEIALYTPEERFPAPAAAQHPGAETASN